MGSDLQPGIYDGGEMPAPPADNERLYAIEQKMRSNTDAWVAISRDDVLLLLRKVESLSDDARVTLCVAACEKLDHPEGIPDLIAATASYVAMMNARARTNIPDSILDAARTKIHDALTRIHG